MSRRDTIILAVLINSALLVVLFATAIRHEEKIESPPKQALVKKTTVEHPIHITPKESPPVIAARSAPVEEIKLPDKIQMPMATNKPAPSEPQLIVESPKKEYLEVTVKKGDYLDRIAKANNVSVKDIMQLNQMTSTRLQVGQVLKLPFPEEPIAAMAKEPPKELKKAATKTYVVQSGDTLWYIANKHHMQVGDLLKINGLDNERARRLQPGDTLKIR